MKPFESREETPRDIGPDQSAGTVQGDEYRGVEWADKKADALYMQLDVASFCPKAAELCLRAGRVIQSEERRRI